MAPEEKTFEFPKQPEGLLKVKDRNENEWYFDGKWWRSEVGYYDKTWHNLLHEFGPLVQLEYRQPPPDEYDFMNKQRELMGLERIDKDQVGSDRSYSLQAARWLIDEVKKYYGITEE